MANTSTLEDTLPISIGGAQAIREYHLAIDTVDTDLTVHTPATGKRVFVVGMWFAEGTATNLTLKSATTPSKSVVLELAANQGGWDSIGKDIIWVCTSGEALVVQSSAAISDLIIYTVEAERMILR